MTRTARALGITRTTFRNASGLPDPQQVTTARDMATLGLRIQRDFPQYFGYFSLRSFSYNGVTHRNHNRMLGRFKGMDGIKTGYIRASGFNLITSVERNRKRMVGVVMGASSVGVRNRYMAAMLETQFAKASFARGGSIAAAAGDPPGQLHYAQADPTRRALSRGKAENTEQPTAEQAATQVASNHLATSEQSAAKQAGAKLTAEKGAAEKLAAEKIAVQKQVIERQLIAQRATERQAATDLAAAAEKAAAEQALAEQAVKQIADQTAVAEKIAAVQQDGTALATTLPADSLSIPSVTGKTFTSVTVEPQDPLASTDAERATVQSGTKSDILASLETPQAEQPELKEEEAAASAPQAEMAGESNWNIQIGAFPTKDAAERRIAEARSSGVALLDGKGAFTMSVQSGSDILYRARFSGFTEKSARAACKLLAAKGMNCFPLAPQG
jgi:D-alanyl-D-alanine carboxypeptidase